MLKIAGLLALSCMFPVIALAQALDYKAIIAPSGGRVLISKSRTVLAGIPVENVNGMSETFVRQVLGAVKPTGTRNNNGDLFTF